MNLSKEQEIAAEKILRWTSSEEQCFFLSGYAGTGKTTLMNHVLPLLPDVVVCAPTGKAASVLAAKTGYEVKTIHSLLYLPEERVDANWLSLKNAHEADPNNEAAKKAYYAYKGQGNDVSFVDNNKKFSGNTILVVDEASMVGEYLAADLLKTNCKVLFIGDEAQLPPVKQKAFFHNKSKDARLTTVHRQALESPILRMATAVRNNEILSESEWQTGDARILRSSQLPFDAWVNADQILTDTNVQRQKLNRFVRKQKGWSKDRLLEVGEKVICVKNNWYRPMPLINGVQFNVTDVHYQEDNDDLIFSCENGDKSTHIMASDYHMRSTYYRMPYIPQSQFQDLELFDYSYAITVHKSQGSEWGDVIFADAGGVFYDYRTKRDARALLYTAITRAKENFTWVMK